MKGRTAFWNTSALPFWGRMAPLELTLERPGYLPKLRLPPRRRNLPERPVQSFAPNIRLDHQGKHVVCQPEAIVRYLVEELIDGIRRSGAIRRFGRRHRTAGFDQLVGAGVGT